MLAGYHMDVFRSAKTLAKRLGLQVEPLGGGRIQYISSVTVQQQQEQPGGGDSVPPSVQWAAAVAGSDGTVGGSTNGRCLIYGYSGAFGPAPHEVAAAIVRRWHPFTDVAISYEGY